MYLYSWWKVLNFSKFGKTVVNYVMLCNSKSRRNSFLHIQYKHSTMADNPRDVADRERIFSIFDANGDGKISASELGESLKTLGSVTAEEVQRMMAEIDTDGDGYISYEEFTEFARANRGLVRDVAKIF
ncbi:hypothetical protein VNO77_43623 [Canavalia gladiata]|uniref:EF-hand domain-containing protein n=1 Tax=Canavalia gladiata TaxID=3824 RepID=A0AAN9JWR9_CANGL